MRPIKYDPKKITYPEGWDKRAKIALESVSQKPDSEKATEVNSYRDVWASLKPELSKISHGKCWYTEALQAGTDTDVDHFRPKNSVRGLKKSDTQEEHPGYWWKAFEAENYRFSCIVANRLRRDIETGIVGGKADEFPIWDESARAWCPDDDCDKEQTLLIDPCIPAEVALITFAENGEATERYSKEDRPKLFEKAYKSIKLYHLNHSDFVNERIKIRDQIFSLVRDAKRFYKKLGTEDSDADNDYAYGRTIEQLRQLCDESAPFSGFAISMLHPHSFDESLVGVFMGTSI
jgi:hypothetical protein